MWVAFIIKIKSDCKQIQIKENGEREMCVIIPWHTIVLKRITRSEKRRRKVGNEGGFEWENEAQENGGNKLWKLHISEKDFLSSVENGTLNGKEAG